MNGVSSSLHPSSRSSDRTILNLNLAPRPLFTNSSLGAPDIQSLRQPNLSRNSIYDTLGGIRSRPKTGGAQIFNSEPIYRPNERSNIETILDLTSSIKNIPISMKTSFAPSVDYNYQSRPSITGRSVKIDPKYLKKTHEEDQPAIQRISAPTQSFSKKRNVEEEKYLKKPSGFSHDFAPQSFQNESKTVKNSSKLVNEFNHYWLSDDRDLVNQFDQKKQLNNFKLNMKRDQSDSLPSTNAERPSSFKDRWKKDDQHLQSSPVHPFAYRRESDPSLQISANKQKIEELTRNIMRSKQVIANENKELEEISFNDEEEKLSAHMSPEFASIEMNPHRSRQSHPFRAVEEQSYKSGMLELQYVTKQLHQERMARFLLAVELARLHKTSKLKNDSKTRKARN
mgnify:CR=1 FL=1